MHIPPLLAKDTIKEVLPLIAKGAEEDIIVEKLKYFSLEEQIHILRFIYNKAKYEDTSLIYRVWRLLLPLDHSLNTEQNRRALYEIGRWWDAFGIREGMTTHDYDALEQSLDLLGATPDGKDFFKWVALYPVGIEHGNIWDEDRRGAIVCLGKYAYTKEIELFLARHLDDWNTIQMEVVYILSSKKSRLLGRLASWYLEHDDLLAPILRDFF